MNTTEPIVCGFDGNQDIYGLGVRVGIYIQVVSFFLASTQLKKESAYLQSSSFVFLFAIFIALVRETANGTLRTPEAAMINWLIVYQIVGVVATINGSMSAGTILRLCMVWFVFPAQIGYNFWFWWKGLDVLPGPPPGCTEYGYFFSKVNVRGWFRTLNKVMMTMAMVMLCVMGLVAIIMALVGLIIGRHKIAEQVRKWRHGREEADNDSGNKMSRPSAHQLLSDFENGLSEARQQHRGRLDVLDIVFAFVRTVTGAGVVLAVTIPPFELTIRWNQIRGVDRLDSVGQLVPFMLSLGQFVHILYSIIRGKDSVRRQDTIIEEGPCPEKKRPGDEEGLEMQAPATQVQYTQLPKAGGVSADEITQPSTPEPRHYTGLPRSAV